MNSKYFVFLEISDAEINSLFSALRSVFDDAAQSTNVHITLRGPLSAAPRPAELATLQKQVDAAVRKAAEDRNEHVMVNGVQRFSFGLEHYVALKIQCRILRRYFDKPDFADEFNPHVTIFNGRDSAFADAVETFLKREELCFYCDRFIVTSYKSKNPQTNLFSSPRDLEEVRLFPGLIEAKKVRPGILKRAKSIARPYKLHAYRQLAQEALNLAGEQDNP